MPSKTTRYDQALAICTIAAIFYCYEYYLRVAPGVISQELMQSFNISYSGLGVLSAFFYYAYMPLQIPVGLLIDKFGPRKVMTVACALCVVGVYLFYATEILWLAQAGRFITGFGSAFAFVGYLKICSSWLPHKYYAFMVGLCMLLGMLGAISGELVLAKLVETLSWQSALLLSVWVGILLTFFIWIVIRDQPNTSATRGNYNTVTSQPVWSSLLTTLKSSPIWISGMIGCFTFIPLSCFAELWAIPYLEAIGYHKTEAAFASSMIFLGFGIGAPLWGLSSNKLLSRRMPLIIGSLVSAISAGLIIYYPYMPAQYMFSALFILGFFSGAEILVFAIGNDITNKDNSGTTTAMINMLVMLGGIILQPVVGMILDVISNDSVAQYQTALLVLPICLFLACGLSISIKETFKE